MCDCGCNTCETKKPALMLNESLAPRAILSEGLKHHLDANKPLTDHLYRAGSDNYFNLWAEARSMYSRNILEITHEDDLAVLTETDLGHFGMFEGKKVPLDFPIELNEQMDLEDELANMEFGMDYDQLGDNEKEWVRDEIDNMSMNEAVTKDYTIVTYGGKRLSVNNKDIPRLKSGKDVVGKSLKHAGQEEWILAKGKWKIEESLNEAQKDIYDKFLDDPQNPKGRAKTIISKFLKQYGENATEMAVDRFAKQNDLKPEEKYILKYITKQDIKISSQPGGPDFSALEESKYKKGDKLKVKLKNGKEFDITFDSYSSNKGMAYGKIDGDRKPFSLDAVVNEAKNDNKKLNKPTRDSSGGKAYKVYVKDPKTKKIKTVRFGSGGLRAKINDKEARNAFAARHKCSTKKDKTKAGYWSCRLPRYAKLLGLKSNFGGFW
jgi:hypothetical protein